MGCTHCLIAHGILKIDDKYLVIKRSKIKRGKKNVFPEYWDLPGGLVEPRELPTDALIRETQEEVHLTVHVQSIIHEDSVLDAQKNCVYTRLVYTSILADMQQGIKDIVLDAQEHTTYKLITSLEELAGENVVPYLMKILSAQDN